MPLSSPVASVAFSRLTKKSVYHSTAFKWNVDVESGLWAQARRLSRIMLAYLVPLSMGSRVWTMMDSFLQSSRMVRRRGGALVMYSSVRMRWLPGRASLLVQQ